MSIKEIAVVNDSYEELRTIGIAYQKKTVESLLSFARVVYVLREKAHADSANVDFNELVMDYWGLSQSGASQLAKTGQYADRLANYSDKLPTSSRSLYELTQLPIEALDKHIGLGDINPTSTVSDIKAIKDSLKEAKKPSTKIKEDNPFEVSAEDEEGNKVNAELVNANKVEEDELGEDAKPRKTKMTILEALVILGVDVNEAYMQVHKKGETDKETLNKAFYTLTGEKL